MRTARAAPARIDRSRPPELRPAPAIRLPQYQRSTLRNGLGVLAVRHDDLPQVAVDLVLPVSTSNDPPGLGGLAVLTARALTEGTRTKSAQEVAEAFDELGVSFAAEVSHDATVLTLDCLASVLEDALRLLVEVVAEPAFDPKEVNRLRDERLDEIARGMDEPRIVANLRLVESIFGPNHPYGRPEGGWKEDVQRIDAEAARRFHARWYTPRGATLLLAGDLEPRELPGLLDPLFGPWSAGGSVEATAPAEPLVPAHGVWAVQRPGSPQSEIRIGGVGIGRSDRDYFAFKVQNAILGGLFNSRINMNLREERGWTYGAYTRFEARRRRGPFYASTAVDAAVTADAVAEILGEMERVRKSPPREDELSLAKNALTLSLPRLFETPGQVAAQMSEQVVYGLPDDYWERYGAAMSRVTAQEVLRVGRRYVRPETWPIVVVGDVESHLSKLARYGDVTLEDWSTVRAR